MKVFGIDVSKWNGDFDFMKAKSEGVKFAILRGAYACSKDIKFEAYYAACKGLQIPVGVYHYSMANNATEARAEANFLIQNVLKGKQFEFPVYFDVEEPDQFDLGKEFCTQLVETFCGELEKAGYMAGVYCSTYWYTYFVDESVRLKRPAFIADYCGRCYYKASYGIWQHGYGNNVPGINANCDLDWGYVDYSQYIKANHLNGF